MVKNDPSPSLSAEPAHSAAEARGHAPAEGGPDRLAALIANEKQAQRESAIRRAHRLRMREFLSRLKPAS